MYSLPFDDHEFDTIILDDVLAESDQPTAALAEARRLLKDGGRLLLLASVGERGTGGLKDDFAAWAAAAGMRLAPPRAIPETSPGWLLGVATT